MCVSDEKLSMISEKSNAAARISYILSNATTKRKNMGGVQVFEFNREGDEYWVVGLRGHIIEIDYPAEFNDWNAVDPKALVYAVPEKRVMAKNIISILTDLGKIADQIIIATDYDREGELIGLETVHLLGVDMAKVKRSKFSAFTKVEIEGAFSNLTDPDERLAKAAESRQYIDLAWGAALTRFISLNSGQVGSNFLSVGRVQSPTLSLVVDRHREITSFVPGTILERIRQLLQGYRFHRRPPEEPVQGRGGGQCRPGQGQGRQAGKGGEVREEREGRVSTRPFQHHHDDGGGQQDGHLAFDGDEAGRGPLHFRLHIVPKDGQHSLSPFAVAQDDTGETARVPVQDRGGGDT